MQIIKCDICGKLHRGGLAIWGGAKLEFGMVDKTTRTHDLCPKCAGNLMVAFAELVQAASESIEKTPEPEPVEPDIGEYTQ